MKFHVTESTKNSILESLPWMDYLDNPFANTAWAPYLALHPKRKGSAGEHYVEEVLKSQGYTVAPRTSAGHDCIVNEFKTEVKFSLASKGVKDRFTWNHLACGKDYDRALLVGINLDGDDRWLWFDRADFCDRWNEAFAPQQGGQKAQNDDFFLLGDCTPLFNLDWMHSMEQWND
jgi:hypothetical protein